MISEGKSSDFSASPAIPVPVSYVFVFHAIWVTIVGLIVVLLPRYATAPVLIPVCGVVVGFANLFARRIGMLKSQVDYVMLSTGIVFGVFSGALIVLALLHI